MAAALDESSLAGVRPQIPDDQGYCPHEQHQGEDVKARTATEGHEDGLQQDVDSDHD